MSFYRDSNFNGVLDEWWDEYGNHGYYDEYVGAGSASFGDWSTSASTYNLSCGSNTYYAVATYGYGLPNTVLSTGVSIGIRPTISYLYSDQGYIARGDNLTLTAAYVSAGYGNAVSFYRDSDGTSGLNPKHRRMRGGTNSYWSWPDATMVVDTSSTPLGTQTYYAVVSDYGFTSSPGEHFRLRVLDRYSAAHGVFDQPRRFQSSRHG